MTMCEANAYLLNNGQEELFLERVDKVFHESDGTMILEDVFGEKKLIQAKIKEMALVEHKIILERI